MSYMRAQPRRGMQGLGYLLYGATVLLHCNSGCFFHPTWLEAEGLPSAYSSVASIIGSFKLEALANVSEQTVTKSILSTAAAAGPAKFAPQVHLRCTLVAYKCGRFATAAHTHIKPAVPVAHAVIPALLICLH
jgi:hypothetical protein